MAVNNTNNKMQSSNINIAELIEEYKSKWVYFAISVCVFLCLGVAYVLLRKPVYNIHASVLISQEDQTGSANDMMKQFNMGDMFGGYSSVYDELAVMTSHDVMTQTVKDLDLYIDYHVRKNILKKEFRYKNSPVELSCDPAIPDTLRHHLYFKLKISEDDKVDIEAKVDAEGDDDLAEIEDAEFPVKLETSYGTFVFNKTSHYDVLKEDCGSFKVYVSMRGYESKAELLAKDLKIGLPDKDANVIGLDYQTPYIDYGKKIVNTAIDNYNRKGIISKQVKDSKTAKFIEERLETLVNELNATEETIEAYKRSHNTSSVSAEASYLFGRKKALENRLIEAETEFEILEMTREFIANPENKYSMIPMTGVGSAQGAIASYNGMIMERMRLESNAKVNNVVLQTLDKQIDAMRENINKTLDKIHENSLVRLVELRKQTQQSQSKLSDIPTQEREFVSIKRLQTIKEQLYLYLLQKQEETILNIANTMERGIVIDRAYAFNKPVSASKRNVILMFFMLGLIAPVAYFYVRNMLRSKFSTKEELEKRTHMPILGEMCTCHSGDALVVKAGGSSSAAELFRLIRSNLQFILGGMNDKVVVVTSTVSGEGKSFISINLATSLAMLDKKVVLIGMDIRCPKLAEYLNLKEHKGLTEYLSRQSISIDDIVIKNAIQENLDIIVAGPVPPNPSELLASSAVDHLFAVLREKYDYIIVDSAPVGMVSDTFSLARISDATVYVCRANYTKLKDIEYINSLYVDNRLKRMALVVNGTKSRKGYGYGYGK